MTIILVIGRFNFMKILCSIMLVIAFSLIGNAQTSVKKTFGKNVIEKKYDKFKDKTSVLLELTISDYAMFENLRLLAFSSFTGEKAPQKLEDANITFFSVNTKPQYDIYRSLIFLVDGERISLGDGEYEKDNSNALIETLKFTLKADVIKKLANSKKVELQLGKNEFVFAESQLEAIKEFYKQLVP